MSKTTLDVDHTRRSLELARRCRELTQALRQGEQEWRQIEVLIGELETHLGVSSAGCVVIPWRLALALLRAVNSSRRLREAARAPSGGVAEESARLTVLLRELEECLAGM